MAFDIREEDENHEEFDEYEDAKQPVPTKFYRRRKFWYFCIPNTIVVLIVAVILGLYVIMPKIAQSLMNKATISFSQIDISNPSATSLDLVIQGEMDKTGPFKAAISFPDPVAVSWNGIELGTTLIPGTSTASGGHGTLNTQAGFTVTNATAFAEFSGYMLNAESFVWHLEGKLNVKALSRTVKNLNLSKDITVNAFNGLTGITIQNFTLPGDDPSGNGIIVQIDTAITNPSAVQIYMGTLTLAISYNNTTLGYVTANNLTMVRGAQVLSLKGVLIPQNTTEGLANVSELMSRYVANLVTDTIAIGYEVMPDGVNSVDWLSTAVKDLRLTVPLQSPEPLNIISALNLGALGLNFTTATAYDPLTSSTGVLANYTLPAGFDFSIQFTQVANTFALSRNNVTLANLNSSYNPSTSDMAAGTLDFNLLATPLNIPDASHEAFQEFTRDLTTGSDLPFNVIGQASVFANTSIGTVNLVNIPFNVSTSLSGLQSLSNPAPTITSLQVVSGTSTELTMAITVVIVNPSSISLDAGDVILDLVYKGVTLGTVTLPNLSLVPGANTVNATSSIDPAASAEGIELLALYTSGASAAVSIAGTSTSTTIDSLALAFAALNIDSQIPGLASKLLAGASLAVLNTTLVNGIAETSVTVNNPFVPAMTIVSIDATITYSGASVGTVASTFATPPVIAGTSQGSVTTSLAMNTNPEDLTKLIREQAIKNGLNTDAFDALISIQEGATPSASVFVGFNVADFVTKAMSGLLVDITMTTTVKLGDYQVTIPYTQTGVPTTTDESVLKLVPLVGTPIAQLLVGQAVLAFESIVIQSPTDTGFPTDIIGAITNTGPLDAQIEFPDPVVVSYAGKAIGSMMMPTVNAVANKGAPLNLTSVAFTVTDIDAFAGFNTYALNNAKFDWVISASGIVVNAMGVSLPGVSMSKTVTLDGFNKLASLQLLSYIINDIDDAGLHMVVSATLANPSTIGISIPVTEFQTSFNGKVLGPAVVDDLVLVPHGNSSFALNVTIATGNGDLTPYLTGIFQNALGGVATPLDAQGAGAPGISWLDTAIKSLLIHTSLPPLTAAPISTVSIDSMTMDFTCDTCTWAPNVISAISATTNLPFANGAPIVQLSQHVEILDKNGEVVGTLNTPYAPSTASGSSVTTSTPSSPLVIADGSHEIYEAFLGDVTAATTYELGLRGTADSVLDLGALGLVNVTGIKIDVKTSIAGLQGLQDIEYINYLGIDTIFEGGDLDFMLTVVVNIQNPSNLTLIIGNLTMLAGTDYTAAGVGGTTTINDMVLAPGSNVMTSVALLNSALAPATTLIFGALLDGANFYLYTDPSTSSSNVALAAGLKDVETFIAIPRGLVNPDYPALPPYTATWGVKFLPSTVDDGLVEITTTFQNPYILPINFVDALTDTSVYLGEAYSQIMTADETGALFDFLDNLTFELPVNGSTTVTYNVSITTQNLGYSPATRDQIQALVDESTSGSVQLQTTLFPMIKFGENPVPAPASWPSSTFYPAGLLTVETGPDFALFLDWYDKTYPPALPIEVTTPNATSSASAIASPSSVPSTAASSPVPSAVPSAVVSSPVPSIVASSPTPTAVSTPSPSPVLVA